MILLSCLTPACVVGVFKTQTMLTILFAIALDTIQPIRPLPVLLPGQVKSETHKPLKKKSNEPIPLILPRQKTASYFPRNNAGKV